MIDKQRVTVVQPTWRRCLTIGDPFSQRGAQLAESRGGPVQ
jgi:hypothetical protein